MDTCSCYFNFGLVWFGLDILILFIAHVRVYVYYAKLLVFLNILSLSQLTPVRVFYGKIPPYVRDGLFAANLIKRQWIVHTF